MAGPGREEAETGAEQAWLRLWLLLVVMPGGLVAMVVRRGPSGFDVVVLNSRVVVGESGKRCDDSEGRAGICRRVGCGLLSSRLPSR